MMALADHAVVEVGDGEDEIEIVFPFGVVESGWYERVCPLRIDCTKTFVRPFDKLRVTTGENGVAASERQPYRQLANTGHGKKIRSIDHGGVIGYCL